MCPKVILSADSACDLSRALIVRYHVHTFPFSILLNEKVYLDGVNITPDDLYKAWWEEKQLPKTASVNAAQYYQLFKQWTEQGYEVVHFSLGSALSSSYQNACLAARDLENVYPINSCNLSTGCGLLVLQAADRIAQGMSGKQIQQEVSALVPSVKASFLLDTLEFLHAGGRCSSLARLGANALHLKPSIVVNPSENGNMGIGKLYRGKLDRCLQKYVRDLLENQDTIDTSRVFITHSGIDQDILEQVQQQVSSLVPFREIHITRAGCTISSHCGPNTLGVLFLTK